MFQRNGRRVHLDGAGALLVFACLGSGNDRACFVATMHGDCLARSEFDVVKSRLVLDIWKEIYPALATNATREVGGIANEFKVTSLAHNS